MVRHNGIEIDRHRHVIRHAGKEMVFSSYRRFALISALILAGPKTCEELFDGLYAHRLDGGPVYGWNSIKVLFSQLKPIFRKLDLEMLVQRTSSSRSQYMLAPIGTCPEHWRIYGDEVLSARMRAQWEARR
jgi:hypothetical protein